MNEPKPPPGYLTTNAQTESALREEAVALFRSVYQQAAAAPVDPSLRDAESLLHDLQVHQIELELQNEELRRIQVVLDASKARYVELYDLAPVGYCSVGENGELLRANLTLAAMLGQTRSELLKNSAFSNVVVRADQDIWYRLRARLIQSETPQTGELRLRRSDANQPPMWVQLSATVAHDDDGGRILRIAFSDITARKQAEQFEQFRSGALELLAGHAPLSSILDAIVRGVERLDPTAFCSISLLDEEGRRLCRGASPSVPDFLSAALEGVEVRVGAGSCATAVFTGRRVIVEDIETHPYWVPLRKLAARASLASCWSQPILSLNGRALGAFAMYHRVPGAPDEAALRLMEQSAQLASLAIERKQAEGRRQLAANVFTYAREGILITGPDGNIIDVNDAFTTITGFSRAESLGRNPRFLSSGRHNKSFFDAMWAALNGQGHWDGEIWNCRKNGEVFAAMQTISAVRNAAGDVQHYVALFADITPLKEHQDQLERLAHFDALTGLPNRVLLADRLHQAMAHAQRRGQPIAVAYLDLDEFKAINDQYGHEAGDNVLITIANRMHGALRKGDTFSRIGGDEFVAVLIDMEHSAAGMTVLDRVLTAAAQPVRVGDKFLHISASLGVTFYPQEHDIDADQLLRQADQAMYEAKVSGKNRYHVFDAKQDSRLRSHKAMVERIRLALQREEFVLFYQPKVNMRSGRIIGAEALIRWRHPEKGLLAPAEFLPLIENHPFSVTLGEWVIDSALGQIANWREAGLDMPVSVNIGSRQIQSAEFVDHLRSLLAKHPTAPAGHLELEVLETSALEDIAQVSGVIEACAQMGVRFALDDFGAGYSSLTYLKRLHVAQLKIDRSFVSDMLDNPDDLAILKGVIGLAAALKREVIAEGVETVAQGVALLELGCGLAQGYTIARPMPADQMPAWAAGWRPDAAWRDATPYSAPPADVIRAG